MDDVQLAPGVVVDALGAAAQFGDGAEDQRDRGAELVADVGEERRLGAVELGEFLGPALLRAIAAGAGDAGGEVARDQADEAAVLLVERAVAIQRGHQEPAR